MQDIFENLNQDTIFKQHFKSFKVYQLGNKESIQPILDLENTITQYVRKQPEEAKKLKHHINKYFKILNLIAFVIEIDDK